MRTVALAIAFETTLLLKPDPGPVPVSANFDISLQRVAITFDSEIVTQTFDASVWPIRAVNVTRIPTGISRPVPTVILLNTTAGPPNPGPNVVSYAPPPVGLKTPGGSPVGSFTDFPLDVIP